MGRALVDAFAREGARVVVADIDELAARETADAVRGRGGQAIAVRVDVSDHASVLALADRAFEAFGRVDILCNNAGVALWGGLESATHRDWQWAIGVNLWGVIHGIEAFVPRMIKQNAVSRGGIGGAAPLINEGGHIVNTASMAGLIASQGLGVYNTTKYAVVGLSETLVKDLRPFGIGVSVLCPLGVATRIRESERNRPAALRNDAAPGRPSVELMGRTLAAIDVAEMVVTAIKKNRLYVITHPEALEPIRKRFQRLERAITGA